MRQCLRDEGRIISLVALWLALQIAPAAAQVATPPHPATEKERADIAWLEAQSMLQQATTAAAAISGHAVQWRHPYGEPQPRAAVRHASVWLLDYPGSVIPQPGQSVLATWGSPQLWDALRAVGIELLHTGPLNRAGGLKEREYTPTLDGWFDRISLELDPALGTEKEYARMVAVAAERGGKIAGDLVPLHTGTGADFQLALRAYRDYPGMYTLVEIAPADWPLLPAAGDAGQLVHVPKPAAQQLARKGYIPGLINSNDAAREAHSWSGWSASGPIRGVDGKVRRWVYLHYFKPTQPTLNWLDPSFAAERALAGDIVRTVFERKTSIVRLDAVPFLGIEGKPGTTETLHFKHPLSVSATEELAFLIRKLGGWSFQELNIPLEELRTFTRHGPDLSYDFITRAQCLHALLTGDAGPLRLAFRWLLEAGVQPITLVHDLQNHDEITYQLVEPEHRKDQALMIGGQQRTGKELKESMLAAMRRQVAGPAAPYNQLYRPERDGLATTFVGFIAPALGIHNPYQVTPAEIAQIRRGHLLLAAANALQPGVFSLSSWDLVGALPIPVSAVAERTKDGDYRWINRGGTDLMGANRSAKQSAFGLPRAPALYGPLPEQLKDAASFASGIKRLLAARRQARLAEGELLVVPEPRSPGLTILVLRLPEHPVAVTALNFGHTAVEETLELPNRSAANELSGQQVIDLVTGDSVGVVDGQRRFTLHLPALAGTTYVLRKQRNG